LENVDQYFAEKRMNVEVQLGVLRCYLSNGELIATAISEGFVVPRIRGSLNARIVISRAPWASSAEGSGGR
jgi:hypothetical protein